MLLTAFQANVSIRINNNNNVFYETDTFTRFYCQVCFSAPSKQRDSPTMNVPIRRRMPQSLKNILTDLSPTDPWAETEPGAVGRDGIMLPRRGQEELLLPSKTPEETVLEGRNARSTVCMMCQSEPSCYTCPRCNLHYCSLACYRSPDHAACSESFYKESVLKELKDMGTTEREGRRKMQDMLLSLRQKAERTDGGMESLLKESGVVSDDEDVETAGKVQVMELLSRLAELQQSEEENSAEIEGVLRRLEEVGGGGGGESRPGDRDEDAESIEDEPDLAERVSGLDIDKLSEEELWELLSGKEKATFMSLVKDGGVARLVPPWKPWWEEHEQQGRALIEMLEEKICKEGTDNSAAAHKLGAEDNVKLSQERKTLSKSEKKIKRVKGEKQTSKDKESSAVPSVPPVSDKIPTLSSLCVKPSPLICFGLVNALYAYAFSLCLLNNDTDTLMFEFCDMVLALSEGLNSSRVFSSIQEAIESGESRVYGEGYLDKEDQLAPSRALEAVAHITTGRNVKDPAGYCLAAFSQLRSVLSKARKSLSKDGEERERRQKYFLASKKCEFFQAWIMENAHQIQALAMELWNEHGKRQCVRSNMEKTMTVVTDSLKKEKNKSSVQAIEELS